MTASRSLGQGYQGTVTAQRKPSTPLAVDSQSRRYEVNTPADAWLLKGPPRRRAPPDASLPG